MAHLLLLGGWGFVMLLERWSNKYLDERGNDARIRRLFSGLGSRVAGDDLEAYIGRLDRIVRRLHDGHLRLELPLLVRRIDGLEAREWLEHDAELQYGSSPHGRLANALDSLEWHRRLSYYKPPRSLVLEDLSGRRFARKIVRKERLHTAEHRRWKDPKRIRVRGRSSGRIFVLRVSTFSCQLEAGQGEGAARANFEAQLEAALLGYRGERSVILDLRGNGGGANPEGRRIAGLFTDRELVPSLRDHARGEDPVLEMAMREAEPRPGSGVD